MEFRLSEHVQTELVRRKLSKELLLAVVDKPQQILPARNGLECRQSRFVDESSGKEYLLRIFVNSKRKPKVVVTAYKTSKIEKYWSNWR